MMTTFVTQWGFCRISNMPIVKNVTLMIKTTFNIQYTSWCVVPLYLMNCTILTSGSIEGALHEKCWEILYKCIFIVNREEGSDESNRLTVLSIDQVYYLLQ